ncbi:MAG: glycogen synthase GlgA [Clostridia bacterium]|nr:glycogen synthase GlgA [Clostridia bacterium]
MKILMAASECVPFIKTGGLADVIGALPKHIASEGEDIRIVIPKYGEIPETFRNQMTHLCDFYLDLGWRRQYCGVETLELNGITCYFIDNEYYFNRPYIYGTGGDEVERFAFFDRAVLEILPRIGFFPDVLHCHDWQTGLIPALLKIQYAHLPEYAGIRTAYTIHNLQYQGIFPIGYVEDLLHLGDEAYLEGGVAFYNQCSFMKGGLNFADRITTVSPTYAEEIQTPYYGEQLDGLLRARAADLTGILNGIDTAEYDPAADPFIELNYSWHSIARKQKNKLALQSELGLNEDENAPLIGMVSRLSGQKGLDLVQCVLNEIMATGAQLVVLGKGEDNYVNMFCSAQKRYPGRIAARIEMNGALAHRIYAACDLFLMPSKFEPCGLSQMIALRYGTLPIVRETGGLRDTVLSYNEFTGEGNGFTFFNYNAHDMLHVIERAVGIYKNDQKTFLKLARRAMRGQYGWDQSAKVYLAFYKELLINK